MSAPKVLFGFHAVGVRLKTAPRSIVEIYYEPTRRDARMRQFIERVGEAGVRLIEADAMRLAKLAGSHGHQGVAARVEALPQANSLDDLLDAVEGPPLLLVLDGVTDPHNLGACLRVADGAGAHAVIAPKDHAAGINATVAKVASGAAETVPYFMVTNLARTMGELKERSIWCIGASDDAPGTIYQTDMKIAVALVLGAEGSGMRQLTRKTCDQLASIPMRGAVESLNVSVARASACTRRCANAGERAVPLASRLALGRSFRFGARLPAWGVAQRQLPGLPFALHDAECINPSAASPLSTLKLPEVRWSSDSPSRSTTE